jgi:aspartyl-tRNA(Asn)/glutamyl-tRNA(Gln) amidotransferase subunit A
MSLIQMAARVRSGETTATELVRRALDAIAQTDPAINAWSEVFPEAALARAAELDAEARNGRFAGPLHGVPIGVKDLFQVAGTCTRRGSRLYEHDLAKETGPVVERALASGAIMVGKNTTPELGWKASSHSPLYGTTRNPWDVSRTTGGSSSGSAAAVAAGAVPLALGTDGGGSLRIPAAFCGIFSMKPHLGRIPTWPLSPAEQLSCAGPMTNRVADFALGLDVLQGPDPRDPNSLPASGVSYLASLFDLQAPLRCVLAPTLFGARIEPEVASVIAAAFGKIRAMPDVRVVETRLDWPDPAAIFDALWVARASLYKDLDPAKKALLDPGFARQIELSARIRLEDHLRALKERAQFCRAVAESFRDFDLLLMPMVPIEPFAAEADGPAGMDTEQPVPWARWTPFSHAFNVTGQPAASIPCGWTKSGLPVGLQVVGARFDELRVLQFCAAWEKVFDWRARRPAVFAGDGLH